MCCKVSRVATKDGKLEVTPLEYHGGNLRFTKDGKIIAYKALIRTREGGRLPRWSAPFVSFSYKTGEKMVKYTDDQILELVKSRFSGKKVFLLAPIVKGRKGHYKELFEQLRRKV